jgi:hypothetical protein
LSARQGKGTKIAVFSKWALKKQGQLPSFSAGSLCSSGHPRRAGKAADCLNMAHSAAPHDSDYSNDTLPAVAEISEGNRRYGRRLHRHAGSEPWPP